MTIPFTPRQEKIISSALTGLALLTLAALAGFVFLSFVRFLSAFSGVLMPLATAGILSLLLRPAYQGMIKKWKLPPPVALILILLAFFVPLFVMLGLFGGLLVGQLNSLVQQAPEFWDSVLDGLRERLPAIEGLLERLGGTEQVTEWARQQSEPLMRLASGGAQGVLSLAGSLVGLFSWVVMPVYLIFLLMAPPFRMDKLEDFLPFLRKEQREDAVFLVRQFVEIVVSFFRGQLVIAFLQGIMMAVGFSAVGLTHGFILGMVLGMLNLVPYLGNLVGLAVTLPLAWWQPEGGLPLLAAVLGVFVVVQSVESYVLTPRIMGKQTGLHPMAVIFAMFFWGKALGGIFGLVLAVPLTAFLVVLWRLAKEKYLPDLEADSSSAST